MLARQRERRRKMRHTGWLVTLTVCVALACVLNVAVSASSSARKTVVLIDVKGRPQGGNPQSGAGTFTLSSGSMKDQGSTSYAFFATGTTTKGTITLMGKKGNLTLRTTSRESGLEVDSQGLDLWVGTWTVAAADGSYKGMHAVGAYVGIVGPAYAVAFHYEGFRGG